MAYAFSLHPSIPRHPISQGDVFYSATSLDGSEFWVAGSGTGSGGSTYTLGYVPLGFVGQYTTGAAVAVFSAQAGKFVDIGLDGNLYAVAQTPVLTGNVGALILATDIYVTAGQPTTAVSWNALGVGATLVAPRGLTFLSTKAMFVCDSAVGLRHVTYTISTGAWAMDPVVYTATPNDVGYVQAALAVGGATLYAVTPSAMYAFNTGTAAR